MSQATNFTEQKDLAIDGKKVHYLTTSGNKPRTIILLHGLMAAHQMFLPLIPKLAKEFNVYALDFPGFGESEALEVNDISHYGKWLYAFLSKLEIKDPILFGVSLGGMVALHFAGTFADIPSLVIVQGAPIDSDSLFPWQKRILSGMLKAFSSETLQKLAHKIAQNEFGSKIGAEVFKHIDDSSFEVYRTLGKEVIKHFEKCLDPRAVLEVCRFLSSFSIAKEVKAIKCPFRVIFGSEDSTVISQTIYEIKSLNPNADIVLHKKGGHTITVTHSGIIYNDITEFIRMKSKPFVLGKLFGKLFGKIDNIFNRRHDTK